MHHSNPFDRCGCGEPLPARYGKGGRPKKCEGCKRADRARREREARARRRTDSRAASDPCVPLRNGRGCD